jgi:hypothetical protein
MLSRIRTLEKLSLKPYEEDDSDKLEYLSEMHSLTVFSYTPCYFVITEKKCNLLSTYLLGNPLLEEIEINPMGITKENAKKLLSVLISLPELRLLKLGPDFPIQVLVESSWSPASPILIIDCTINDTKLMSAMMSSKNIDVGQAKLNLHLSWRLYEDINEDEMNSLIKFLCMNRSCLNLLDISSSFDAKEYLTKIKILKNTFRIPELKINVRKEYAKELFKILKQGYFDNNDVLRDLSIISESRLDSAHCENIHLLLITSLKKGSLANLKCLTVLLPIDSTQTIVEYGETISKVKELKKVSLSYWINDHLAKSPLDESRLNNALSNSGIEILLKLYICDPIYFTDTLINQCNALYKIIHSFEVFINNEHSMDATEEIGRLFRQTRIHFFPALTCNFVFSKMLDEDPLISCVDVLIKATISSLCLYLGYRREMNESSIEKLISKALCRNISLANYTFQCPQDMIDAAKSNANLITLEFDGKIAKEEYNRTTKIKVK